MFEQDPRHPTRGDANSKPAQHGELGWVYIAPEALVNGERLPSHTHFIRRCLIFNISLNLKSNMRTVSAQKRSTFISIRGTYDPCLSMKKAIIYISASRMRNKQTHLPR